MKPKGVAMLVVGDEMKAMLEQAEQGNLDRLAMRVYLADGTYEDIVAGGTEEERAKALAELQAIPAQGH